MNFPLFLKKKHKVRIILTSGSIFDVECNYFNWEMDESGDPVKLKWDQSGCKKPHIGILRLSEVSAILVLQ